MIGKKVFLASFSLLLAGCNGIVPSVQSTQSVQVGSDINQSEQAQPVQTEQTEQTEQMKQKTFEESCQTLKQLAHENYKKYMKYSCEEPSQYQEELKKVYEKFDDIYKFEIDENSFENGECLIKINVMNEKNEVLYTSLIDEEGIKKLGNPSDAEAEIEAQDKLIAESRARDEERAQVMADYVTEQIEQAQKLKKAIKEAKNKR